MGDSWAQVRNAAVAGTLNRSDPAAAEVCRRWDQLLRAASLRLSTETGADVLEVIPKAQRDNPRQRSKEFLRTLCGDGTLTGVLRVPAAAGDMTVTADIRASIVEMSASLAAPDNGTPRAAVVWLVKQLSDAPAGLIVDTYAKNARNATSETLERLRNEPRLALGGDRGRHPARFRVRLQSPMGAGRRSTPQAGVHRLRPGRCRRLLRRRAPGHHAVHPQGSAHRAPLPRPSRREPVGGLITQHRTFERTGGLDSAAAECPATGRAGHNSRLTGTARRCARQPPHGGSGVAGRLPAPVAT